MPEIPPRVWSFIERCFYLALFIVILLGLFLLKIQKPDLFWRAVWLVSIPTFFVIASAGCIYLWFLRKKSVRLSSGIAVGLLALAFLIVGSVSVLLDPKLSDLFKVDPSLFLAENNLQLLGIFGTVLTIWAAASTAFILLSQIHSEEHTSAGDSDAASSIVVRDAEERIIQTLVRVKSGFTHEIKRSESQLIEAIRELGLARADDEEAIREFNRWTQSPRVRNIYYFGSFSLIPGFWKRRDPPGYDALISFADRRGSDSLEVMGPDVASFEELVAFIQEEENVEDLADMKSWSKTVEYYLDVSQPDMAGKLTQRYSSLVDELQFKCRNVVPLAKPWRGSSITFTYAQDEQDNSVGSIFFGSPLPGDGFLPGEIGNLFNDPLIYLGRGREIGSLLIHLRTLLDVWKESAAP